MHIFTSILSSILFFCGATAQIGLGYLFWNL